MVVSSKTSGPMYVPNPGDAPELSGPSNRDAAMRAGISEATFYSWMQKARKSGAAVAYVQFLESLERAQADLKAVLLARVQKASVDGQWQAATWMLARKFPKEFGQTVETTVQHSGHVHTAEARRGVRYAVRSSRGGLAWSITCTGQATCSA